MVPLSIFKKVETGRETLITVDVGSKRSKESFLAWMGYRRTTFPLSHIVAELRNKMVAARGRRNGAMWKGPTLVLDLEVRGRVVQLLNNSRTVGLVVNSENYEPLDWFAIECIKDDKAIFRQIVLESVDLATADAVVGLERRSESAGPAGSVSASSKDLLPTADAAHPPLEPDEEGSDSPELSGGELDDEEDARRKDLQAKADSLKSSPMKHVFWTNSKHSFVVQIKGKRSKQFHVSRRLAQRCLEDYVEGLEAARQKAIDYYRAMQP